MKTNDFQPYRIVHFDDGMNIPSKYIDIVADMKYSYYNTNVDWQLRIFYTFYSEALRRLKKWGYITDRQYESLSVMNNTLYRERLHYQQIRVCLLGVSWCHSQHTHCSNSATTIHHYFTEKEKKL